MSLDSNDLVIVAPPTPATGDGASLEWAPILGGAVLSIAITTVMTAFGSALGLSLVSVDASRSSSMVALSIVAGLWTIWITVSACGAGGYLTGRMRRPSVDTNLEERGIRDGAHGLIVWAVGALVVAMLASSSLMGAADRAARGVAAAAGGAASLIGQDADPLASALDQVMRSNGGAPVTQEEHSEVSRMFVSALGAGQLQAGDRDYIASRVAARMNIPQPEAQQRVDAAYSALVQARDTARDAAEKARRVAVVMAFITAAVLLLGAVAAWLAAQLGGKHRDEQAFF